MSWTARAARYAQATPRYGLPKRTGRATSLSSPAPVTGLPREASRSSKRSEKPPFLLPERKSQMRYDFAQIQALQSRARRERSEAVHRLIIAPILALFASAGTPKRSGHAPRPHLARQG